MTARTKTTAMNLYILRAFFGFQEFNTDEVENLSFDLFIYAFPTLFRKIRNYFSEVKIQESRFEIVNSI